MVQKTALPENLCADEAVCFIADRHHVTPQQLLRYFIYGETSIPYVTPQQLLRYFIYGETSIPLEANEVEILKGLSGMIRNDRTKEIKTR